MLHRHWPTLIKTEKNVRLSPLNAVIAQLRTNIAQYSCATGEIFMILSIKIININTLRCVCGGGWDVFFTFHLIFQYEEEGSLDYCFKILQWQTTKNRFLEFLKFSFWRGHKSIFTIYFSIDNFGKKYVRKTFDLKYRRNKNLKSNFSGF